MGNTRYRRFSDFHERKTIPQNYDKKYKNYQNRLCLKNLSNEDVEKNDENHGVSQKKNMWIENTDDESDVKDDDVKLEEDSMRKWK